MSEQQERQEAEKLQMTEGAPVSKEQRQEAAEGHFFTPRQLAERLHYSYQWILSLLHDGYITAIRPTGPKGQLRIPESEVRRIEEVGLRHLKQSEQPVQSGQVTRIVVPEGKRTRVTPETRHEPPDEPAEERKERRESGAGIRFPWDLDFMQGRKEE